jgi:hypothetical protein
VLRTCAALDLQRQDKRQSPQKRTRNAATQMSATGEADSHSCQDIVHTHQMQYVRVFSKSTVDLLTDLLAPDCQLSRAGARRGGSIFANTDQGFFGSWRSQMHCPDRDGATRYLRDRRTRERQYFRHYEQKANKAKRTDRRSSSPEGPPQRVPSRIRYLACHAEIFRRTIDFGVKMLQMHASGRCSMRPPP